MLTHQHHRLFATAMVAFVGVELLARMTSFNDTDGNRGRFVHFVTTYSQRAEFAVNADEAEAL
jgi:hypothetical protein